MQTKGVGGKVMEAKAETEWQRYGVRNRDAETRRQTGREAEGWKRWSE